MELENKLEKSDEQLVSLIKEGEVEYFREIVERYEKKIFFYVRRFLNNQDDARDLTQDVFVKVYKNIQSFDSEKRFSPWIYRIAHNEAVNIIKKKIREPLNFFDPEVLFPHPVANEDPQSDAEKNEIKKALEECLEDMDEKYKEVLILRYFEDMDYKDIAEILKIPVVTVGVRLNRGKDKLREIYEKKFK
ncbi:MAG: RNA polymerase sigma factor [Candidatus Pacebacteria bacterium]|nr:RNA polymerase sigma factor [Candidatus Paceibacterota bacterium]